MALIPVTVKTFKSLVDKQEEDKSSTKNNVAEHFVLFEFGEIMMKLRAHADNQINHSKQ